MYRGVLAAAAAVFACAPVGAATYTINITGDTDPSRSSIVQYGAIAAPFSPVAGDVIDFFVDYPQGSSYDKTFWIYVTLSDTQKPEAQGEKIKFTASWEFSDLTSDFLAPIGGPVGIETNSGTGIALVLGFDGPPRFTPTSLTGAHFRFVINEAPAVRFDRYAFATRTNAVPEPATWAMMIAGFGLAGSAVRWRRRVQAA